MSMSLVEISRFYKNDLSFMSNFMRLFTKITDF